MEGKGREVIVIRDLKKYYGRSRGVEKVNLMVREGEIFGFLGPNGAGKTTTIRTMLDYIRPTSGSIRVLGRDPVKEGAEVRREIGYLPSDFSMEWRMTALKYLRFLLGMMEYSGRNRIEEMAERFELDLDKRIKDFSRGNRQKVGLVSAFMHYPQLLIMDEPTTGLDPLMQQEFYRLVLEEKKRGATVFLSSHILSEVDAVCDRVGVIREGELVAVETIDRFKEKTGQLMKVRFESMPDTRVFEQIDGISDVKRLEDETLQLTVFSNVDAVVKELAKHTIKRLSFEETSMEHVFLKYYGKQEIRNSTKKEVVP
ncbi:MAG: ABC transporter ATP-binding protein [Candidatus Thermoplasmatota archaeon]|nr:ABC transporter ATP-binding protein [Candidatus Thermoplasmatota archaeon]